VHAIFHHDYPLAVEPASTPRPLVQKKKTLRDSVPIDMLFSAVSFLVVIVGCYSFVILSFLLVCLHIKLLQSRKQCE